MRSRDPRSGQAEEGCHKTSSSRTFTGISAAEPAFTNCAVHQNGRWRRGTPINATRELAPGRAGCLLRAADVAHHATHKVAHDPSGVLVLLQSVLARNHERDEEFAKLRVADGFFDAALGLC